MQITANFVNSVELHLTAFNNCIANWRLGVLNICECQCVIMIIITITIVIIIM